MAGSSFTPERIDKLESNEVFVFGSNLAGRHGKGAALQARLKFGAIYGQGSGFMGQSYGIATKDSSRELRVLPLREIAIHVDIFLQYARVCPNQRFLVTAIGCGEAGYSPREIAPLFFASPLPANVVLPKSFWPYFPIRLVEIGPAEQMTPAHFSAVRSDGLSFLDCVGAVASNKELLAEFDRLNGTNLSLRGAPIDLAIDEATGRQKDEIAALLRFAWNCVFIRRLG